MMERGKMRDRYEEVVRRIASQRSMRSADQEGNVVEFEQARRHSSAISDIATALRLETSRHSARRRRSASPPYIARQWQRLREEEGFSLRGSGSNFSGGPSAASLEQWRSRQRKRSFRGSSSSSVPSSSRVNRGEAASGPGEFTMASRSTLLEDEGTVKAASVAGGRVSLSEQKKLLGASQAFSSARRKSDMLVSAAGKPVWSVAEFRLSSPKLMLATTSTTGPPITEVSFPEAAGTGLNVDWIANPAAAARDKSALLPQYTAKPHARRHDSLKEFNASFATAPTAARSTPPPSPITPSVRTPTSSAPCTPTSTSASGRHQHYDHTYHQYEPHAQPDEDDYTDKDNARGSSGYESTNSHVLIREVAEAVAARDSSQTPTKKRRRKKRRRNQNRKSISEKNISVPANNAQPPDHDKPRRRSSNGSHLQRGRARQTDDTFNDPPPHSSVSARATLPSPSTPAVSISSGAAATVGSSSGHGMSDSTSNHTSGHDDVASAASLRSRKSQQSANSRRSSLSIKSLRAVAAKASSLRTSFTAAADYKLPAAQTTPTQYHANSNSATFPSHQQQQSFDQDIHNVRQNPFNLDNDAKVGIPKRKYGSHSEVNERSTNDRLGARRRRTVHGTVIRQDYDALDSQDDDDEVFMSASEQLLMQYLIDSGKNTREAALITAKFSVESKKMRRSSSLLSLSHLDDTKSSSKSGTTIGDDVSTKSWGRDDKIGSADILLQHPHNNRDLHPDRATITTDDLEAGRPSSLPQPQPNNSSITLPRPSTHPVPKNPSPDNDTDKEELPSVALRGNLEDEWITKEKLTAMAASNGSFGATASATSVVPLRANSNSAPAPAPVSTENDGANANTMTAAALPTTGAPLAPLASNADNATVADWKNEYRMQLAADRAANSTGSSSEQIALSASGNTHSANDNNPEHAGSSDQTQQMSGTDRSPVLVRASRPGAEQMRVRAYGQRPSWARQPSLASTPHQTESDEPSNNDGRATNALSSLMSSSRVLTSVVPEDRAYTDEEEGQSRRPRREHTPNAQIESALLEAHAVDANGFVIESDIPVVEADVMPPAITLIFKSWRNRFCCTLIVLILVAVCLSVALIKLPPPGLNQATDKSNDDMQDDNDIIVEIYPPTIPPTSSPTRDSTEILTVLGRFSSMEDLTRPGSPQNTAMRWLLDEDSIGIKLDDRMYVQRYAMVVLVFATCNIGNLGCKSFKNTLNPVLHECDWGGGVSCSEYTGNQFISSLELSKNQLDGTLPYEIGLFERLELFDAHENKLQGSIPASIGNLPMLDFLDLGNNGLTGSVPSTIKGNADLATLSLAHNELSGSIPDEVWQLEKIRRIFLRNNFLTGQLSSAVSKLKVLTHLDLTMNLISGKVPKEISDLQDLAFLYFGENILSGPLPVDPMHSSRRVEVVLYNNAFSGTIPLSLDPENPVRDGVAIQDFRLQKLDVSGNLLSGSIPELMGFIESVKYLDFSRNDFMGSIPHTFGQYGSLSYLEHISFARNKLTGTLPNIGNDLRTRFVDIHGNGFHGVLPSSFGSFKALEYLDVSDNRRIEGEIPKEYGGMLSARNLILRGCSLSGKIPTEIGELSFIEFLDLGDNSLSRTVPTEVGKMISLRELCLDSNGLIGKIPKAIGALSKLQVLKLNNNTLRGPIPEDLSFLMDLEEVHLEDNSLSGVVPEEICRLHDHKLSFIRVDCEIQCGCCQVNGCG